MGPFPSSQSDLYILLAVDYVSKWVEAIATPKNDAKTVMKFLHKNIFIRFGVPMTLISDEETALVYLEEVKKAKVVGKSTFVFMLLMLSSPFNGKGERASDLLD
ncbi:hypothetical protein GQ457_09G015210 [Hibiscus cannabinus]